MDNKSAFDSGEYDRKIKQTLPYYDVFYKEVIELVKTLHHSPVTWLDIGCGTGKMGSIAFETVELEKFVFCDASDEMIRIAKERFSRPNAGKSIYLEKWKRYQMKQGKSPDEIRKHIDRYGKDYFPITWKEHLKLMKNSGFKAVEILWLSNMQVGFWGIKSNGHVRLARCPQE